MKKEKNKSGLLYGRYCENVENGTITIPWIYEDALGYMEKPLYYRISEHNDLKTISVYSSNHEYVPNEESQYITTLEIDGCTLDENDKWVLPNSILEILNGETECVWLGIGNYIELHSKKALEDAAKKIDVEEMKEFLLKLGF